MSEIKELKDLMLQKFEEQDKKFEDMNRKLDNVAEKILSKVVIRKELDAKFEMFKKYLSVNIATKLDYYAKNKSHMDNEIEKRFSFIEEDIIKINKHLELN